MIGKLRGVVDELYDGHILLDVNGVCYLIHCSDIVLHNIKKHDSLSLFIEMQVSEGSITMFGFESKSDNSIFLCLTSVQGVGGKAAISIMSKYSTAELVDIIRQKQQISLQLASGIGPKLASRIVNELSNHKIIIAHSQHYDSQELDVTRDQSSSKSILSKHASFGIQALVHLGFHKQLAILTVNQIISRLIENKEVISEEDLIKMALAELGRKQ